MKGMRICLIAAAMIAVFLIPQAAFAEISPQGTYTAGGIIENDYTPLASGDTAYYRINGVNDTDGDLLLSVFGCEAFSYALGYENELGEFTEYDDPRVIHVDASLEFDPEDTHDYIRYENIQGISKDCCYLKVTNNGTKPECFRGSVTNVADRGAYSFGTLKKTTFGKDASVVYHYHPKTDLEKNCLVMLNSLEFEDCALDYFLVDAEGNALNLGFVDWLSTEYHAYTLKDAEYELYIQPSLSESVSEGGITAPTVPVPYKFGIMPQNLKYFTISTPKSYTYNGKAKKPSVTVKYGGIKLVYDEDYYLNYYNNKNAGTAKVTVKGFSLPKGSVTKTFKIKKAANPMKVRLHMNKSTKAKFLRKQSQPYGYTTIHKKKGTVKQSVKYANAKSKKALIFYKDSTGGTLVVKKGTKKGTYKLTIKTTSGNKNYKKKTITKKITVRVK